jgi:uncharacterized membrane protein
MKTYYKEIVEDLHGEEITSKEEIQEFYEHGLAIIEWFIKKRSMYFSKKGYELVGIEVPIDYDLPNKIRFVGYIDVLIYDTVREKYKIIDINKVTNNIKAFIDECFIDGEHNQSHIYRKEASKKNCRFCEFNQTEHCDAGVK